MNAIIDAGYPYEIAGLVLYVFFLYMIRKRGGVMYSQRTRILTIVAAIGLVGAVPFHYADKTPAVAVAMLLGAAALTCAFLDRRAHR